MFFNCRFFLNGFPVCCNLFLVTPCLVVAVQPCMEWIPIKKKNTKDEIQNSNLETIQLTKPITAFTWCKCKQWDSHNTKEW